MLQPMLYLLNIWLLHKIIIHFTIDMYKNLWYFIISSKVQKNEHSEERRGNT